MKPLKLTLKNFGPFAGENVIDFASMGDGLYLILGKTGAGKTSIFDGIVYALYGVASGSGRTSMNTEEYHSDFAKFQDHKEEMCVTLEFSAKNEIYKVERRIYWGVKGRSKTVGKEAILYRGEEKIAHANGAETNFNENAKDSKRASQTNEVSAKIQEILQLDPKQFKQIIMLSQGEFRRFLEAGTSERAAILGKIYNNAGHKDLQARLKAVSESLKSQLKKLEEGIEHKLTLISCPEELSEDAALLRANHPEVLEAVERIILYHEKQYDTLQVSLSQLSEQISKSEQQFTISEEQNKKLKSLEQQKRTVEFLERERETYQELSVTVQKGKDALKVVPYVQNYHTTGKEINESRENIATIRMDLEHETSLSLQLTDRKEYCDREIAREKKLGEQKIHSLEEHLPAYEHLEKCTVNFENTKKKKIQVQKMAEETEREFSEARNQETQLNQELDQLTAVTDASVELIRKNVEELSEKQNKLCKLPEMLEQLKEQENTLAQAESDLQKQENLRNQVLQEYAQKNQAFLDAQAGILARNLQKEIDEKGQAVCPVCGQLHVPQEHHNFAQCAENAPSQKEVDQAYKTWTQEDKKWNKNKDRVHQCSSKVEQQSKELLQRAEELLGSSYDLERIRTTSVITKALLELQTSLEQHKAALILEEEKLQQKSEKVLQLKDLRERISNLEQKKTAAGKAVEEAATMFAAAESQKMSAQEALKGYPSSRKEAETELEAARVEVLRAERLIKDAQDAVIQNMKNIEGFKSRLAEAAKYLEEQEKILKQRYEELQRALAEYHFDSLEMFHQAMAPQGRTLMFREMEHWLKEKEEAIQKYREQLQNSQAVLLQMQTDTDGLEWTDTSLVLEKINEFKNSLNEFGNREKAEYAVLKNCREGKKACTELIQKRGKLSAALKRIQPLSDTAENKTYAFSTYVLEDFFRQIVELANEHLSQMTSGQYSLLQVDGEDARSQKGLELVVDDAYTGKSRDTRSLSGGESFKVSLSLALGLSDMVQRQNSGQVQIDSMFIDEGFGSLDEYSLKKAIEVLHNLAAGHRQIGIISHVEQLEEILENKIHVVATQKGSYITTE